MIYPRPDPDSVFGENPQAEKKASAILAHTTVAGQPVHLTGFDALFEDSGADSDGPGQGSTFTVILPAAEMS